MEQMKYDVFISYSRKDMKVANRIMQAFNDAGITCFIDRQGIGGGMEFPAVLAKAIRESKIFLFLASKNSYSSKFTQSEIVYAFNKKQKQDIIPFIIDGSSLPEELEFTFSAINWRRIEDHPIDSVLVDDILSRIGKSRSEMVSSPEQNMNPKDHSFFPFKGLVFTGKHLAQIVLGLSVLFMFCMIFFTKNFIQNHYTFFESVSTLSLFFIFIMIIIGLIRPASICITNRKEVLKYYLTSLLFCFIGFIVMNDADPTYSEIEASSEFIEGANNE